jgi:SAM-dependent methyltransferase
MLLYAATIFLSAFLLFLVQPVITKLILPWFGGSAAVWTTCLVFFQTALLAGYAYADFCVRRLTPRGQVKVQTILLLISLAVLPIIPTAHWKPAGDEDPSWLILGLLTATIGLPYFLLSTTSPLVQTWFARAHPGVSPYRLFALSNLASMLALVGYPFLFEPWSPTRTQAFGWSIGYGLFVGLCIAAGWASVRKPTSAEPRRKRTPDVAAGDDENPPPFAQQLMWCTLAATGSILLLAVTNQITRNIAAVPMLWIAPLAIYLLTFILAFNGAGWYRRRMFLPLVAVSLAAMAIPLQRLGLEQGLIREVGVFLVGLFFACSFAHGELSRLKPASRFLTRFYLMVSLGGALGAVLVGIVVPLVLPAYFELVGGLVLCALLLYWQMRSEPFVLRIVAIAAILATVWGATSIVRGFYSDTVLATRNFYGVIRIREVADENAHRYRVLMDGSVVHGTQYLASALRRRPTTYYAPTSGIGRLLTILNSGGAPLKIGVVGLGAGTLATYGRKGDIYRFYEINPSVIRVARRDFTYLSDTAATIETMLGDARLSLEREPSQDFDVLAIDAFSSDSIPVHLITLEALTVYRKHIKPGGVIAFHISNRFLNLGPVVEAIASIHQLRAGIVSDPGSGDAAPSTWVLLSDRAELFDAPDLAKVLRPIQPRQGWRPWTDDFNNIVQALY